jgi:hypothetical protein
MEQGADGGRDIFHASIRDALDKGKAEAAGFEAAGRPGDGYIHITGESPRPLPTEVSQSDSICLSFISARRG